MSGYQTKSPAPGPNNDPSWTLSPSLSLPVCAVEQWDSDDEESGSGRT